MNQVGVMGRMIIYPSFLSGTKNRKRKGNRYDSDSNTESGRV